MPNDVTLPLANALPEFAATRRAEARASHGNPSFSDDGAKMANPRFDRMISSETHQARVAEQALRRRREDRSLPDVAAARTAPERPEPKRAERSAPEHSHRSEENTPRKDGRASRAGSVDMQSEERPACNPDGGKPVEADEVATDDPTVCVGHADEPQVETVAGPAVEEQGSSDVTLLAEALLAAEIGAGQTADAENSVTDPTVKAGVASPVAPGVLPTAQAGTAGTAANAGLADAVTGVTGMPAGVVASVAPAVQAQKNAQMNAAVENAATDGGADGAPDAGSALLATSKTSEPGTKAALTAEGSAESGETAAAVETGKGAKAEAVVNKSTTPNLHPTRAAHFADFLEAFGGSSAIHRPADILAGLDRSLSATMHNRGTEVARPTPLQMLPIEIGMQAVRGVTNFQIRLDPAELGRIDVKLQIRANGEVNASLIVDRVETLQMLKRDASSLEFAFEQAGLKQSPDGLTFSLRGEGQNGQKPDDRQHGGSDPSLDDAALAAQIGEIAMRRVLIPNSSIDRMV